MKVYKNIAAFPPTTSSTPSVIWRGWTLYPPCYKHSLVNFWGCPDFATPYVLVEGWEDPP